MTHRVALAVARRSFARFEIDSRAIFRNLDEAAFAETGMARAFDTKPARSSPSSAPRRSDPQTRGVPPAADFTQLANRLHVGAPIQRRAAQGAGRDFSGITGPGRPAVPGGLPAGLRADVEARSGLPMDDVRVHRHSDKPARIGALAYAQGRDIHLGPGQERHLAHEAWHVVQQKQGRVRATSSLAGLAINDDDALEREATVARDKADGFNRDGATGPTAGGSRRPQALAPDDARTPIGARADPATTIQPFTIGPARTTDPLRRACATILLPVVQMVKNKAFKAALREESKAEDDASAPVRTSLDYVEHSLERGTSLAYIINAIVSFNELGDLTSVINAMAGGLDEVRDYRRIAVVLGVNAPAKQEKDLKLAIGKHRPTIDAFGFPIAMVPIIFKKKQFPHGEIRNKLLESAENRDLTEHFLNKKLHPYIYIQDFDTGSRRTGNDNGRHIFLDIDERLRYPTKDEELSDEDYAQEDGFQSEAERAEKEDMLVEGASGVSNSRPALETLPLMIVGGYRTGDDLNDLTRRTKSRFDPLFDERKRKINDKLDKTIDKIKTEYHKELAKSVTPTRSDDNSKKKSKKRTREQNSEYFIDTIKSKYDKKLKKAGEAAASLIAQTTNRMMPEAVEKFMEKYPEQVGQDMEARNRLARMHPLLPYAPEPNTFLDATAVMIGSPNRTQIRFGDKSAEAEKLAKNVNLFARDELQAYYEHKADLLGTSEDKEARAVAMDALRDKMNLEAELGRHPTRGVSVMADYESLNIETDLSRMTANQIVNKKDLQSHGDLKAPLRGFYDGRKGKSGGGLKDVRDEINDDLKKIKLYSDLGTLNNVHKRRKATVGNSISPAISAPFHPSKGLTTLFGEDQKALGLPNYGLNKHHEDAMALQIAINDSMRPYMAKYYAERQAQRADLDALIQNFRDNALLLSDTDIRFRVSHWTEADGDCGVYALLHLLGIEGGREGLRGRLVALGTAPALAAARGIWEMNRTLWLSDDQIMEIGRLLGLGDIAVVRIDPSTSQYVTITGDPANSEHVVGGVPSALDGPTNHWVVLRRA